MKVRASRADKEPGVGLSCVHVSSHPCLASANTGHGPVGGASVSHSFTDACECPHEELGC